jgi:hypothetical protein
MQSRLANASDGELILKLYELRTEATMREARRWLTVEFWPKTAEEFFAVQDDFGGKQNCWLRQVVSYWEMAASLVLHGSLSAELFVDCNTEPFFLLAKLAPLLPEIHERMPTYMSKMRELVEHSQAASAKYDAMTKTVATRRAQWKTV